MNLVLNWDVLRGDVTLGWILGLVWVLNGLIGLVFFFFLSFYLFMLYLFGIRY